MSTCMVGIQDPYLSNLAEGSHKLRIRGNDSWVRGTPRAGTFSRSTQLSASPIFCLIYPCGKMTHVQELPEIQQQFVKSEDGNQKLKFDQHILDSIKKYQIGLATFGVNEEVFPCLASPHVTTNNAELKNLVELIQELLVSCIMA
ncbi:6273_t:CDS:2 [Paraglomus occultum]|uniref:6273_t:CDS:1 n=1 Tax=Paraglomus occultum TaxID=144539 RepID=A0A9N9ACI6_9GLOM|nr:6273_t:CDS:2 [Paraglomus occultum]